MTRDTRCCSIRRRQVGCWRASPRMRQRRVSPSYGNRGMSRLRLSGTCGPGASTWSPFSYRVEHSEHSNDARQVLGCPWRIANYRLNTDT